MNGLPDGVNERISLTAPAKGIFEQVLSGIHPAFSSEYEPHRSMQLYSRHLGPQRGSHIFILGPSLYYMTTLNPQP